MKTLLISFLIWIVSLPVQATPNNLYTIEQDLMQLQVFLSLDSEQVEVALNCVDGLIFDLEGIDFSHKNNEIEAKIPCKVQEDTVMRGDDNLLVSDITLYLVMRNLKDSEEVCIIHGLCFHMPEAEEEKQYKATLKSTLFSSSPISMIDQPTVLVYGLVENGYFHADPLNKITISFPFEKSTDINVH